MQLAPKPLLIFVLAQLLGYFQVNAQQFQPNFLGADYLRYKGVFLKLDTKASGLSHMFYNSLEAGSTPYNNAVLYPEQTYTFNTVGDSLAKRVFVVEDILGGDGRALESKTDLPDDAVFILKDTATDKRIYYRYDVKFEHRFPFITSRIQFDKKQLCAEIDRSVDDFTRAVTFRSPQSNGFELTKISIQKTVSKTGTRYYFSLRAYGSSVVVDGKGVIILFTDGTKLSKSVDIDVEADKDQFEYTAFIPLTSADLLLLSTKKIKKYRLYIFDEEVSASEADKLRLFTKCVMEAK